jgi:GTP:adenosylcobinamide-phosphate guanylyltransferase
MLSAIVTAGGIPQPGEPLYPMTQGKCKALLEIAGKPMIQWVIDALEGSSKIQHIVIIGLPQDASVTGKKIRASLPNQEDMLANIRQGVQAVLKIDPSAHHVVVASSDIPGITAEMVDWLVDTTMQTDEDVYYTVIERSVMEARFPESRRSYTRQKDVEVCGGDINVIRTMTVTANDTMWKRIIASRKNVFKQAALIGYDTLFLLLLRQITLEQAVKTVASRMKITGRAVLSPYAEMGMDVDKPHQFEMVERDLQKKYGKRS